MAYSRTYRVLWALFLVMGMVVVPAVPAAGDDGIAYEGNPKCEDLNSTWKTLYKADFDEGAPASGSSGPVTWNVRNTDNGEVVDWSSSTPMIAVLVKGGPGGNLYDYSPAGASSGSGLHALPRNRGNWADISHVTFCQTQPPEPEPATVKIVKRMEPADPAVAFTFTSSSLPGFPVDLGHDQSATVDVEAGDYSVTEQAEPGWELTSLVCNGASGVRYDLAAGTAAMTVGAGDDVTCTFVNEKEAEPEGATLTLEKITNPADGEATFRFFGPDGWRPVLGHGDTSSIEVEPGTYTLRERFEHAWELTSIVCDGGEPVVDLAGGTATVTVGSGDDVTCRFTNTRYCPKHGWIAIEKYTEPVDRSVRFAFESDAADRLGNPFEPVLRHGESDYVMVMPGTYSITELPVPGWQLAGLTCDDPDAVIDRSAATATVTVSSSELATCRFTNRRIEEPEPGTLIVEKLTDPPGADENFAFTSSIPGWSPQLGDEDRAEVEVEEGVYTVTERPEPGWELTGISCTDPEAETDLVAGTATVFVPADGEVTCTFRNKKIEEPGPGELVIEKETEGDGDADFEFTSTVPGFEPTLRSGESAGVDVEAGTYSATETVTDGWQLTAISCTDPEAIIDLTTGTATVEVPADTTVTCTFTNARLPDLPKGKVIVKKVTEPGGADQEFLFSVLMGDGSLFDGPLRHGESVEVEFTTPDPIFNTRYVEIGEHWVDGWRLTDITCDDEPAELSLENGYVGLEIGPGETVTCTFTNAELPLGSIGDFVWHDVDRDGVQDRGEPGIGGVRVNLYAVPGTLYAGPTLDAYAVGVVAPAASTDGLVLLATTVTDSGGIYHFTDLPAGDYVVEFTNVPTGYGFTKPFAAARTIDSDASTTDGRTPVMPLGLGIDDTTCDAGLYALKGPTGEVLPVTGANLTAPAATGAALLAIGLLLLLATRPKRQTM